jgi:hypothetical protein
MERARTLVAPLSSSYEKSFPFHTRERQDKNVSRWYHPIGIEGDVKLDEFEIPEGLGRPGSVRRGATSVSGCNGVSYARF